MALKQFIAVAEQLIIKIKLSATKASIAVAFKQLKKESNTNWLQPDNYELNVAKARNELN